MANQRFSSSLENCFSVPIKIGGRKKALVMSVHSSSSSFRHIHQTSDIKKLPSFWLKFKVSDTHSSELKSLMARIGESSDDPFAKGFGRGHAIPLSAGGQTLATILDAANTDDENNAMDIDDELSAMDNSTVEETRAALRTVDSNVIRTENSNAARAQELREYAMRNNMAFIPARHQPNTDEINQAIVRATSPEEGVDLVCQKLELCSSDEMFLRCTTVCNIELERDQAQLAHTWAVGDQVKFGLWGRSQNNDVHLLCRACHLIVDEQLRQ
jgi:hypothetical protein